MDATTTHDITNEFGLAASARDLAAVREELRRVVANLHPDRTGGEFPNEDAERAHARASTALVWIDAAIAQELPAADAVGNTLVPIDRVLTVIEQAVAQRANLTPAEVVRHANEWTRTAAKSRQTLPRVTSGILGTVFAGLAALLQLTPDTGLGKAVLAIPGHTYVLCGLAAICALFFLATWLAEHAQSRFEEGVLSEESRYLVLLLAVRRAQQKDAPTIPGVSLGRNDIEHALAGWCDRPAESQREAGVNTDSVSRTFGAGAPFDSRGAFRGMRGGDIARLAAGIAETLEAEGALRNIRRGGMLHGFAVNDETVRALNERFGIR